MASCFAEPGKRTVVFPRWPCSQGLGCVFEAEALTGDCSSGLTPVVRSGLLSARRRSHTVGGGSFPIWHEVPRGMELVWDWSWGWRGGFLVCLLSCCVGLVLCYHFPFLMAEPTVSFAGLMTVDAICQPVTVPLCLSSFSMKTALSVRTWTVP